MLQLGSVVIGWLRFWETFRGIKFNPTQGAFYNTIVFDESLLTPTQSLAIEDPKLQALLDTWLVDSEMPLDKRFVYYLLAAEQICVVPILHSVPIFEAFE